MKNNIQKTSLTAEQSRFTNCCDTVTQVSTIDALLSGIYDGSMTLEELRNYGDIGLGTLNELDGEMILIDGKFYQIRADGKVYEPPVSMTTPFASVAHFKANQRIEVGNDTGGPLDYAAVQRLVNHAASNRNLLLAVVVKGHFKSMKTRSLPRQRPPYPPLTEVTRHQPEFSIPETFGTIVGFRLPDYIKGISVPGFHLHFLSEDCKHGGHILAFELLDGVIELDYCNRFYMALPKAMGEFATADLNKDRTAEMEEAEQSPLITMPHTTTMEQMDGLIKQMKQHELSIWAATLIITVITFIPSLALANVTV